MEHRLFLICFIEEMWLLIKLIVVMRQHNKMIYQRNLSLTIFQKSKRL